MKPVILICGLGVVAGFAGCDFGHAYEARLNESRETLVHAELLSRYVQANAWARNDLGLSLRIPQEMKRLREPEVDADGKVTPSLDPDVEPIFRMSLPNRIATFRTYIEVGVSRERRRLPVYLYVAAANPSVEQQAESGWVPAGAFRDQVVAAFTQAFPSPEGAEEPKFTSYPDPNQPVHGVTPKTYEVIKGRASGEMISLRGGRNREVPETVEAGAELYLRKDENLNWVALLLYWPQGPVEKENPLAGPQLHKKIDFCLETVEFASP